MVIEREPRKCRRHRWQFFPEPQLGDHDYGLGRAGWFCGSCLRPKDEALARRGKNNRARGNAIEREVGKQLGLRRVGQYGGPDDLSSPMFAAQVKSGGSFSERYWQWLKAVPTNAGQTPLLVVTDAPGPGRKRRAIVVLAIEDWRALHGGDPA